MNITKNGPQNVGQIHKQFICGNLFLSPDEYQRENAWDLPQKRLLIDTIFQGMDIRIGLIAPSLRAIISNLR